MYCASFGSYSDRFICGNIASGTKSPVLPWRVRYKAALGTAKALDYLHHGTSRPVIHRDVKTSNILFTADFESQVPTSSLQISRYDREYKDTHIPDCKIFNKFSGHFTKFKIPKSAPT